MKLQTSTDVYRTVCFSPEKRSLLKQKLESTSPVKLERYQIKRNARTGDEELILNKRTRIEEPNESETDFDYRQIQTDLVEAKDSSAEEILHGDVNIMVNIAGRITFDGAAETLNVKGKTLNKQEAIFTDNTSSVRVVLWENDMKRVESKQCYHIRNVAVKSYGGANYLTFTKHTMLEKANLDITRQDAETTKANHHQVTFPPDGINYVQHYFSCNKCHSKLTNDERKILKCPECGLTQLKAKCNRKVIASVLSINDKKGTMSLNIFDDIIAQLYTACHEKGAEIHKNFMELTDDDVIEMLLTVEATVLFNEKKNAIKVITPKRKQH